MAYVPPALRRKQEAAAKGEKQTNTEASTPHAAANESLYSLRDIQKHFWPKWAPETRPSAVSREDYGATRHTTRDPGNNAQFSATEPADNIKRDSAISESPSSSSAQDQSTSQKAANPSVGCDLPQRTATSDAPMLKPSIIKSTRQLSTSKSDTQDTTLSRGPALSEETQPQNKDQEGNVSIYTDSVHPHNTLNNAEEVQDTLKYVLLFHDANPRWSTDKIIYVKSALDLLPELNPDYQKENQQLPLTKQIMIFEQRNSHRTVAHAMFAFIGYFNLINMQILEPQTPELVRMQEQKWTRTDKHGRSRPIDRNADSWKKSLTQRWAVLKFEKDEDDTRRMGPPFIEATSNRRNTCESGAQDRKCVNEMLNEMRSKDGT